MTEDERQTIPVSLSPTHIKNVYDSQTGYTIVLQKARSLQANNKSKAKGKVQKTSKVQNAGQGQGQRKTNDSNYHKNRTSVSPASESRARSPTPKRNKSGSSTATATTAATSPGLRQRNLQTKKSSKTRDNSTNTNTIAKNFVKAHSSNIFYQHHIPDEVAKPSQSHSQSHSHDQPTKQYSEQRVSQISPEKPVAPMFGPRSAPYPSSVLEQSPTLVSNIGYVSKAPRISNRPPPPGPKSQSSNPNVNSNRLIILYRNKNAVVSSRPQNYDLESISTPSASATASSHAVIPKFNETLDIKVMMVGPLQSNFGFEKEIQRVKKTMGGGVHLAIREIRRVQNAMQDGHVFEMRLGDKSAGSKVREELLKRGWVEKTVVRRFLTASKVRAVAATASTKPTRHVPILKLQSTEAQDWTLVERLLNRQPANLVWVDQHGKIFWPCVPLGQIINRLPHNGFILKEFEELESCKRSHSFVHGFFTESLKNLQWIGNQPGTPVYHFPRAYRLFIEEEQMAFIQDYRLTASMSLLKLFIICVEDESDDEIKDRIKKTGIATQFAQLSQPEPSTDTDSNKDSIELSTLLSLLDFAILQIKNYTRVRRHEDLDHDDETKESEKAEPDWEKYLEQCCYMSHGLMGSAVLKEHSNQEKLNEKYLESKEVLEEVKKFWPQFHIDGRRNAWIFKPSNGILGRGILVLDKYQDIISKKGTEQSSFIVQKYVERPLLIKKFKFDVRLWFLICSGNALAVWIYRQGYVRFCTKPFSLETLDDKAHLTSKGVQQKHPNDPPKDQNLPESNMWTTYELQQHLKSVGEPTVWSRKIYPAMKKALLTFLLSTRESIAYRPGSFSIHGADFIIADDFIPWLIDLTAHPNLTVSTTNKCTLASRFNRDVFKVILDWSVDKQMSTGDFELLHQDSKPLFTPTLSTLNLDDDGPDECLVRGIRCKEAPSLHSPISSKVPLTEGSQVKKTTPDGSKSGNPSVSQIQPEVSPSQTSKTTTRQINFAKHKTNPDDHSGTSFVSVAKSPRTAATRTTKKLSISKKQ